MRVCILLFGASLLFGQSSNQETPLFALPYSPSLDVSSMDRSADPCNDFIRYSCGGWIKKNPIPPDQARWDVYAKLEEENERFLWGILEQAAKPAAARSRVETEIGDYFHACMDESAMEKAGAAPLKPELDEIAALNLIRDLPALLVARQHLAAFGDQMMFGFGSNQDFAEFLAGHRIRRAPAGWVCRIAITIRRPTPNPSRPAQVRRACAENVRADRRAARKRPKGCRAR